MKNSKKLGIDEFIQEDYIPQDSFINREKVNHQKRMIKLLTADFSNYENSIELVQSKARCSQTNISKLSTLKEEIQQKKENFIQNSPSSIIRRQESPIVPQFIKDRDEQVRLIKQYRSQTKDNILDDENTAYYVWIPITASFILILILYLFVTKLIMGQKLS